MVAPGLSHILTAEKEKKKRKLVLGAFVKKLIRLHHLDRNFVYSCLHKAHGKSKNNNEILLFKIKFEQMLFTV